MSLMTSWNSISARIAGLSDASRLLATFLQSNSTEIYGAYKEIGGGCHDTLLSISLFKSTYAAVIPQPALDRIETFTSPERLALFEKARTDIHAMKSCVTMLASFRSELEFLLTNQQEEIRSVSERAFLHLQRLLAVDEIQRGLWMKALKSNGEVGCEKLGAVHLLHHGIFAFKVDGSGARTDLVFSQPVSGLASRGIEGLVLTEWKVCKPQDGVKAFAEARSQMELYQQGVLQGIELAGVRYAVVVSEVSLDLHQVPDDLEKSGIIYRHINIAINPLLPSQASKRAARSSRRHPSKTPASGTPENSPDD